MLKPKGIQQNKHMALELFFMAPMSCSF